MGCCFSNSDDKTDQPGDPTERTRLLDNVVSNSQTRPSQAEEYGSRTSVSSQKKGDEQSALNRILQQTATNVIDVSALDNHNLEQHEYMDRSRQYSHSIAVASTKSNRTFAKPCLLTDIPAPERILAMEPTAHADIQLIISAAEKASKALADIKIEHREDLVVQFVIP